MRKRIIALLLAGCMVFGLTACGSKNGDSFSEESYEETEEDDNTSEEEAETEEAQEPEEDDAEAESSGQDESEDQEYSDPEPSDVVTLKKSGVSVTISSPYPSVAFLQQDKSNGASFFGGRYRGDMEGILLFELVSDDSVNDFMDRAQTMFDFHFIENAPPAYSHGYLAECENQGCGSSDYTLETNIGKAYVRRYWIGDNMGNKTSGSHCYVFYYMAVPLDNDVILLVHPSVDFSRQVASPDPDVNNDNVDRFYFPTHTYNLNWGSVYMDEDRQEEPAFPDDEMAELLNHCSIDK